MLFWNENHVNGSKSLTTEINFIAVLRQLGFSDLSEILLAKNWIITKAGYCDKGLSVASVLFVKGAVTWPYSAYKIKDLPETTEQKSTGLILVIASRRLKESWVFSIVFHQFSMKWQLTRQLISMNWRLISESSLVCRRCNWNNYGPITVHPLVGESFSRVGSIQRNITSLKLVLALVNGNVISL